MKTKLSPIEMAHADMLLEVIKTWKFKAALPWFLKEWTPGGWNGKVHQKIKQRVLNHLGETGEIVFGVCELKGLDAQVYGNKAVCFWHKDLVV